jgi:N utilization substance protein B
MVASSRRRPVCRNILRIAVFELLHEPEVPARAVLNEAIEIGKKYSTA